MNIDMLTGNTEIAKGFVFAYKDDYNYLYGIND